MIPDRDFLKVDQVLNIVRKAVQQKQPLSLVRVGDGENIILAQDTVMPIQEVLKIGWAKAANQGKKGVTLPNLKLRDEMAEALNKADMVGIPFWHNDPINTYQHLKRPLTDAVFRHLNIQPKQVCHTFVNRVFSQRRDFWRLLKVNRVLLIGAWADKARVILQEQPYGLNIPITIPFTGYEQIEDTLKKVVKISDKFDVALVSCGVNAVILSQRIAELTGKVAIDFGKVLMYLTRNLAGLKYHSSQANKNLVP